MKKIGLLLTALLILNVVYATDFNGNYAVADTSKPQEVKIEKTIINGESETKIWIDGKLLKAGSAEYEKYAKEANADDIGVKTEKRKITIKRSSNVETEFEDINPDDIESIDVRKTENGKQLIIKKKNGEVIEKAFDTGNLNKGNSEVIIITNDSDTEIDDIETIDIEKVKGGKKIILKRKNGEVIEKMIDGQSVGIDVEVEETENGKSVIIKEEGKEDIRIMSNDEDVEVFIFKDKRDKVIRKEKRKSKSKQKDKKKQKVKVIIKEIDEVEEIIIDDNK